MANYLDGHPDNPRSVTSSTNFALIKEPAHGDRMTIIIKANLAEEKTGFAIFNSGTVVHLVNIVTEKTKGLYAIDFSWRTVPWGEGAPADNTYLRLNISGSGTSTSTIEYAILVPGTLDDLNWVPTSQDWTNEIDRRINLLK